MEVPNKLTEEFLVVELVNQLQTLAEDREQVLTDVALRLPKFDSRKLKTAVRKFGTYSTQLKFNNMLGGKIFYET
jgi:hypothetical protein